MRVSELDLRGSDPASAPPRASVTAVVEGADRVRVRGPVPALSAALTVLWRAGRLPVVGVSWEPADDPLSRGLARALGPGAERELSLVRDDHGGVLLHHGRIEAAEAGEAGGDGVRRLRGRRLGAQAHHYDARIEARPDWTTPDALRVSVVTVPLRPARHTRGRALQVACDPATVTRDGVVLDRPVTRWTWYADDRVRWRLLPG